MTAFSQISTEKSVLDYLLGYCHVRTYPSKYSILRVGENNTSLFFILEGSVSVTTEDDVEEGRELIYAYLNKGEFIGEVGIFNETTLITANVKTRCQCKLAEISHSRLQYLLKHELVDYAAGILFLIGKQLAARLVITSRNFRDLAFMDTEGRIARTLLDLCHEPNAVAGAEGTQIKITRHELSRLVGCSREVAGRVLKELEHKNMISMKGKNILVFQPPKPTVICHNNV